MHKNSSIPDGDKFKKIKLSKSGSKPLSSNANAPVVGMKRSPPSHSHTPSDGTTKKKKKPSENLLSFSKGKPSAPLPNDASTSSPFPLTAEIKDLKVKFKPIPAKEPEKRKDHGSDGHHKGKGLPHSSKGKDLKGHSLEHKSGSDKKTKGDSSEHKANLKEREKLEQKNPSEKRRKEKKEKKEKREKKIVEKVTIRRSSGDSWASSGSSSGLMPNVLTKNKALGKLLREMSDDEEEAENLLTPFKRETSPKFPKTVGKESNSSHPEKAAVTNRSKHKAKENKTHTNSNNNHTENRSVSHVENGITEKFNSVSEVEERVKTSVDGKEW